MYECFVNMYAYIITCVPCALKGQKSLDPLEVELYMVASCQIGTGNQTLVLYKNSPELNLRAIQPALLPYLVFRHSRPLNPPFIS